ncbi:MAG: hypothetical protein RL301_526 [Actinomycetota bacterium]
MVKNGNSAQARKAKLITLIEAGLIHSQSDAVTQLKKSGFKVTQATASRDLEDLGAVRGRSQTGEMIYQLSSKDPLIQTNPNNLILSIESSGNLVVIKTPAGGAQLLASNLDHGGPKSIIGTIAGDDTVLVIARKANGGAELAKELSSLNQRKNKGRK